MTSRILRCLVILTSVGAMAKSQSFPLTQDIGTSFTLKTLFLGYIRSMMNPSVHAVFATKHFELVWLSTANDYEFSESARRERYALDRKMSGKVTTMQGLSVEFGSIQDQL